jgi:hypothetical protein
MKILERPTRAYDLVFRQNGNLDSAYDRHSRDQR